MSCINREASKSECYLNNENLVCNCDKLNNSNSKYELYLFNEKNNFIPVENFIGSYYTGNNY